MARLDVWRVNFDQERVSFDIVECADGPYLLCTECAEQVRAQIAELKAKGKLPST